MVLATFEEKRDFSVAVCVLKQVGFAVKDEPPQPPAVNTSLNHGTYAFDCPEDSGPRLSSITPAPRLVSQPAINESRRGSSSPFLGDLCFTQSSSIPGGHGALGHGLSSQDWLVEGGSETTLSSTHQSTPWTPPLAHLNPYNYFASNQNFEKYIPKISSPLRNTLFTRASTPEMIDPQLRPVLGRRASFTHSSPTKGLSDGLWDDYGTAAAHSQPPAQVNHYMACETSPESSQTSSNALEMEQDELEKVSNFRTLMPQPRNLPFRLQLSVPEGESSPSKSPLKRAASPAKPLPSSKGSSNQAKTSLNVKEASSEIKPPDSKPSPGPSKGKSVKRPMDDSPMLTGKDNSSLPDSPKKKKTKLGKVKESRAALSKSRPRTQSKLSESSPKPTSKAMELSAVKGSTKGKTQERSVKGKAPSSVTNDISQQKLPKNRPVTRKSLREAGGATEQLKEEAHNITTMSQERPQGDPMALPSADKPSGSMSGDSVQDCIQPVSLLAQTDKAGRASKSTVQEEESKDRPCDKKKRSRVSKPSMPKKGTQGNSRQRSRGQKRASNSPATTTEATSLTTNKTVASNTLVSSALPSSRDSEISTPGGLDIVEPGVVLVTDEMLKRVNEATSAILDQYVADVERGCDESLVAKFYLERVDAVRKDTWYMQLAGGRGLA